MPISLALQILRQENQELKASQQSRILLLKKKKKRLDRNIYKFWRVSSFSHFAMNVSSFYFTDIWKFLVYIFLRNKHLEEFLTNCFSSAPIKELNFNTILPHLTKHQRYSAVSLSIVDYNIPCPPLLPNV